MHGMAEPSASAFVAMNKLGYSRGSADRELAEMIKGLQGASAADIEARARQVAEYFGLLPENNSDKANKSTIKQIGPGKRD
jgi:hypothetical protein